MLPVLLPPSRGSGTSLVNVAYSDNGFIDIVCVMIALMGVYVYKGSALTLDSCFVNGKSNIAGISSSDLPQPCTLFSMQCMVRLLMQGFVWAETLQKNGPPPQSSRHLANDVIPAPIPLTAIAFSRDV